MGWTRLSRREIYANPWMTVYEDDVRNPRGGTNSYGWVHFRNHAVAVVPLADNGDTWLVGQQRYTLGEYSWELPMGGSPDGESTLTTAHRELAEETGLIAAEMTPLMSLAVSNSITDERATVYVARGLTETAAQPDETEVLQVRRLPLAEAVEMAMTGAITDALSVAALLRVTHEPLP
ncbi:MAG: NUDIX hydrolase [Pseudomonadota bacterium]